MSQYVIVTRVAACAATFIDLHRDLLTAAASRELLSLSESARVLAERRPLNTEEKIGISWFDIHQNR